MGALGGWPHDPCILNMPCSSCPLNSPPIACRAQVRIDPTAFFSIHLEVATTDGNPVRMTASNLFKQETAKVRRVR